MQAKIFQIIFSHLPLFFFIIGFVTWHANYLPGFYDVDLAYLFESVSSGALSLWHSYIYSFIFETSWNMTHSTTPLLFLQTGLFAISGLWLLRLMQRQSIETSMLFLFLVFINPLHSLQLLAFLRDSFFSALVPLLFLLLFSLRYGNQYSLLKARLFALAFVSAVMIALRLDAIILLPVVILIVYRLTEISRPDKKLFLIAILILAGLFNLGLGSLPSAQQKSDTYILTSFVHPLSAIAHSGSLTKEEEGIIDRIISVDSLRSLYNPIQITPFHQSGARLFEKADWQKLISILPKIFWRNFSIVIESRYEMMMANLGFKHFLYFHVSNEKAATNSIAKHFKTLGLEKNQSIGNLGRFYSNIESWSYSEPLIKILFFSALPSFFLSFLILLSWQKNPFSTYLLLLCWLRLPAIFLFAPGAHMKYAYPFYIGTLFCFFIAKIERHFLEVQKINQN